MSELLVRRQQLEDALLADPLQDNLKPGDVKFTGSIVVDDNSDLFFETVRVDSLFGFQTYSWIALQESGQLKFHDENPEDGYLYKAELRTV